MPGGPEAERSLADLGELWPVVRVLDPGLKPDAGDERKVFVVGFDPGGTTGWCVMRINLRVLAAEGLRGVAMANPDPAIFSMETGVFTGPEPYHAEMMAALLRGTWMHSEGIFDAGPESDLFICSIESFSLREVFTSDPDLLSPVRVTAAFHSLTWRSLTVPVVSHSPSDAKRTFTDHRLKMLNLWTDGEEHPRDATRQAALAARKVVDSQWIARLSARMSWLR